MCPRRHTSVLEIVPAISRIFYKKATPVRVPALTGVFGLVVGLIFVSI